MSRRFATSFAVFSALLLAPAAQAMPMAGSFTGHVDSQTPQVLGPNHVKVENKSSGTSTSPGTPLDGAQVTWVETVTLKNGGAFSVAYSSPTDFTGAWKGQGTMPGAKMSGR